MKQLTLTGRILYGTGIAAVGIHQLVMKAFRPEIVPAFPAWAHHYIIFPILVGLALLAAGIAIAGFNAKNISLYLGYFFGVLIVTCQLPDMLFVGHGKISSLAGWFPVCETLAFAGGALVIAGVGAGRILFAVLMIVFGCSHFVYTQAVSTMVPSWAGMPMFWTYFVGVALVGAGVAIVFKLWIKPAALLLALMLFSFFLFFHIPDTIKNPSVGHGNEIVRAFVALMFCGIALSIATADDAEKPLI